MVDTTITHQLRTTLAKSVKDQNVNIDMLGISGDTMKLKKHIAIFIERIAKGVPLSASGGHVTGMPYAIRKHPIGDLMLSV